MQQKGYVRTMDGERVIFLVPSARTTPESNKQYCTSRKTIGLKPTKIQFGVVMGMMTPNVDYGGYRNAVSEQKEDSIKTF